MENLSSNPAKKLFFNWGNAIVLVFILFASFICSMVYFMTAQKVDLVSENYYQSELTFQKQIEVVKNTTNLKTKISIQNHAQQNLLEIAFPTAVQKAEVTFFRPSDRNLDKINTFSTLQNTTINLKTDKLKKGIWKIKVDWNDGKKDYFSEQEIRI